jgi:hypothetical protein
MKVVHELVTYFDRKGALPPRELRKMLDDGKVASDPPTNMMAICEQPNSVHYFRVTGVAEGQVWGSGPYTRDSVMGAAAVHAGLLKPGETDVLRLVVMPALPAYKGTVKNGVTTSDYGDFPHCWMLSRINAVKARTPKKPAAQKTEASKSKPRAQTKTQRGTSRA